ncbi:hypothetical protein DL93DRAFT_2077258 [Clavulina sp. PMI_390]|nr:hypothetical protein DL93DRAFT_2077258 [Clavulina sp. PMI_390]
MPAPSRVYAEERPPSRLKVASVVVFYMVSALVMVFVNKAVLNSTPELPFTFLFIQLAIAVVLLHALAWIVPKDSSFKPLVALPEVTAETAYKLLPTVSVGIIALVFNTLCLRNVDASFFQIARGLLLPCTILITALNTRLAPRAPVLRAAALVTAGFFIGISPQSFFKSSELPASGEIIGSSDAMGSAVTETGLKGLGMQAAKVLGLDSTMNMDRDKLLALLYGTLSALMTAMHAVMVKNAVKIVEGSVMKLTYWTNLLSATFLLPCILLNGELSLFVAKIIFGQHISTTTPPPIYAYDASVERSTFLIGCLVTGFFGFLLGMAGLLSIKVTSPVTHMVSSAARSVLQTILGVWFFGEIVTGRRAGSITVITLGALYYTWVQSSHAPPPPASTTASTSTPARKEELSAHEREKIEEEYKADLRTNPGSSSRTRGNPYSLSTLLPLHSPSLANFSQSPARFTFPFGFGRSNGSTSPPASPSAHLANGRHGRLGSIVEEHHRYGPAGTDGEEDELIAGASGSSRSSTPPPVTPGGTRVQYAYRHDGYAGEVNEKDEEEISLLPEDDQERERERERVRRPNRHVRATSDAIIVSAQAGV